MSREYPQLTWSDDLVSATQKIVELAIAEDLAKQQDWTSVLLIKGSARGEAIVGLRETGVLAGLSAIPSLLETTGKGIEWNPLAKDGQKASSGQALGTLRGNARDILLVERTLLNLVGRLCGIATLTNRYVEKTEGTSARIYDTRKTTPGWRLLEKYAVKCGGGWNHRHGLYGGILIKDNHLAERTPQESPAEAVTLARQAMAQGDCPHDLIVEVELDDLDSLGEVLAAGPDIVLLDNMSPDQIARAVQIREQTDSSAEFEASGGVNLETVADIAASGVERISVGALTHGAVSLDVGLDWVD